MEAPRESARVDAKASTQMAIVTTCEEVDELLRSNAPYESIIFAANGAKDLTKIAKIITDNQKTLRHVTLDRPSQTSTIPWNQTKEFGLALEACQELRSLQIMKFHGLFSDGIKYLLTSVVRLTNLECLNFKETYLAPHFRILDDLSKFKYLQILNFDQCAFLYHTQFLMIFDIIKKSTSLRELDLGRTPIELDKVRTLLQAFNSTGNYQIKLIWGPPADFQENGILIKRLMLATNWDDDQTVKSECLSDIESLESGNFDQNSVKDFKVSSLALNKLQKVLYQRRNPSEITKLQFTITDLSTDIPMMLVTISSCLDSLEVLEVTAQFQVPTDRASIDFWSNRINSPLDELLEKAIHLHTVKFINFGNMLSTNGILIALASLPKLKVLVLKDTYLREAGSKLLDTILQKKTLTELDVSNSGLVSDPCFQYLTNGLSRCPSLQRLVLGQSPMTGTWLKMLVSSAERNLPSEIVWQPGDVKELAELFKRMCMKLHEASPSFNTNTFLSNFLNQDLNDLKKQTAALLALQQKDKSEVNLPRRGFFGGTAEHSQEMQPIRATYKGYGTANGK